MNRSVGMCVPCLQKLLGCFLNDREIIITKPLKFALFLFRTIIMEMVVAEFALIFQEKVSHFKIRNGMEYDKHYILL